MIDQRGGWRAAMTLSDGTLNVDIDPSQWSPADAYLMVQELMNHFKEEALSEEGLRRDAEGRERLAAASARPSARGRVASLRSR